MATKRPAPRKGLKKSRKSFGELLRRAESEVATLLNSNKAGTITKVELNTKLNDLNTGLKEVEARLRRMLNHVIDIL